MNWWCLQRMLNDVTCFGESDGQAISSLNGTAQSFLWDNGETTATAINLTSGLHAVTIVDVNGCEGVGTIQINEPADPVELAVNLLQNVSCFGGEDGGLAGR